MEKDLNISARGASIWGRLCSENSGTCKHLLDLASRKILTIRYQNQEQDTVLVGLTALRPLPGWTWIDGKPLQNYTEYFWINGRLPPKPSPNEPPSEGNQCAAIMWLNGKIMQPKLKAYECESGQTNYVCKMTPETAKGTSCSLLEHRYRQHCNIT